jgi:hypothetical protein
MKTSKSMSLIRVAPGRRRGEVAKRILLLPVVMTMLAVNGCVHYNDASEPASWPKPVSVTDPKQFDGVYTNQNVKVTNYRSGVPVTDLFDFITGRRTTNGVQGSQVEIRAAKDGSTLHVRLLDGHGLEIAATDLHRGSDFDLSDNALALYGPFSGYHGSSGNLGAGVGHQTARLYVSSTHDLLGTQSKTNVALLFYFVPSVLGGQDWILWPRLASPRSFFNGN